MHDHKKCLESMSKLKRGNSRSSGFRETDQGRNCRDLIGKGRVFVVSWPLVFVG